MAWFRFRVVTTTSVPHPSSKGAPQVVRLLQRLPICFALFATTQSCTDRSPTEEPKAPAPQHASERFPEISDLIAENRIDEAEPLIRAKILETRAPENGWLPGDVQLVLWEAVVNMEENRPTEVRESLQEAVARARIAGRVPLGERVNAFVTSAWWEYEQGDFAAAETIVDEGLKLAKQAIDPTAPNAAPHLPLLQVRARARFELGKFDEALEDFRPLVDARLDADHVSADLMEDLIAVSDCHTELGDPHAAGESLLLAADQARALGDNESGLQICGWITDLGLTPEESPWLTVRTLKRLGRFLERVGRIEDSLNADIQALDIAERSFGSDASQLVGLLGNLALALSNRGDLKQALSLNLREISIIERDLGASSPQLVTSLVNCGAIQRDLGDIENALSNVRRALQIVDRMQPVDGAQLAHVHNALGSLLYSKGNKAEALPHYQHALDWRLQNLPADHPAIPVSMNNIGTCELSAGHYEKARATFSEALTRQQSASGSDHVDTVSSRGNLAESLWHLGMVEEAAALRHENIAIVRQAYGEQSPAHIDALNRHTMFLLQEGNLDAAGQSISEAESLAQGAQRLPQLLSTLYNKLDLARLRSDLPTAYSTLERLRQIGVAELDSQLAWNVDNAEALLDLQAGNYTAARNTLMRLLENPGVGDPEAARHNLALVHLAAGDYAAAIRALRALIDGLPESLSPTHPKRLSTALALGRAYARADDYQQAKAVLEDYLNRLRTGERYQFPMIATELLNQLSIVEAGEGNFEAAREHFTALGELIRNHDVPIAPSRALINTYNSATFNWITGRTDDARTDFENMKAFIDAGHCDEPNVGRCQRSLSFFEFLEHGLDAAAPHIEAWQQWYHGRINEIVQYGEERDRLRFLQTESPLSVLFLRPDLAAETLLNSKCVVLDSVRGSAMRLTTNDAVFRVIELQEVLEEDEVFIDFARYRLHTGPVSWRWAYGALVTTSEHGPHWCNLGPADNLDRTILTLRRLAARSGGGTLENLARTLSRSIWTPLLEHIPSSTKKISLSPDGALHFVPFAALPLADEFLAERYDLTTVAAGRDLILSRRPSSPKDLESKEASIHLIGGIDFDSDKAPAQPENRPPAANTVAIRSIAGHGQFSPLPHTRAECDSIRAIATAENWMTTFTSGSAANEAYFRQAPPARILHLATHGFFPSHGNLVPDVLWEDDSFSVDPMNEGGIVLAGANNTLRNQQDQPTGIYSTHDDGILTARDIASMDFGATDLVVLSACGSGVGQASVGDGVFGLQRAFLVAGASNVLFTLWEISDEDAPRFFVPFYKQLLAGVSPDTAHREAQRRLLQSAREEGGIDAAVRTAGAYTLLSGDR